MKYKLKKFCFSMLIIATLLTVLILAVACSGQHSQPKPSNPSDTGSPDISDDSAFGEWVISKEATCVEDGLRYRTNSKGDRQEEVIPAKGHSYGEWVTVKEATTTDEGLKERTCARCDDVEQKVISAIVDGTNGLEYTYWSSADMYYITGAGDALEVKDLVIPSKYKGKTVIYVYKDSLNDMPNLETVKFADDSQYTYIYPNAFKGCKNLKSVEFPGSITYLPASFATGCDALQSITVSENNQSYCSVDGVVYTKDMKSLVAYPQAKKGTYTVPATLTSITYVDIFRATNYPLSTAYGITEFAVESGNTTFAVDANGILYSQDMQYLYAYPLAKTDDEIVIDNENLYRIQAYAFANNTYLNSVTIANGGGYKSILGYAFYNTAIKYLEMDGISTLNNYAIYYNKNLQNVVFNSGNSSSFSIYYYAMVSNTSLKKVVLPHVMSASLSNGVLCTFDPFWGCTALEEIVFEQGDCDYVSANGAVFTSDMECLMFIPHAKTSLNLPNTLNRISSDALKYNDSLTYEIVDGLKYYQNWLVGVVD